MRSDNHTSPPPRPHDLGQRKAHYRLGVLHHQRTRQSVTGLIAPAKVKGVITTTCPYSANPSAAPIPHPSASIGPAIKSPIMTQWRTDRRGFLQTAGAAFTLPAKFARAAEGDTLRLRVGADFQVIEPKGIIGVLDEITPRCTQVALVGLRDMRNGNKWQPWCAEKIDWIDPTKIGFTLREGLQWSNGLGPITPEDEKFSFERIVGSDSAWAYQFEKLDHVEIIDARSGIIHLKEAFTPFMVITLPY